MIGVFDPRESTPQHDLCVVGSGPVGIATALRAAHSGLKVLLLEGGGERADRDSQRNPADQIDAGRHAPIEIAAARAFGGTSAWWGGRCVPFDPPDFAPRPWVPGPGWPIAADDLAPWLEPAVDFLGCGPAQFRASADGWEEIAPARFEALERWTPETSMARRWRDTLAGAPNIAVRLHALATHIALSRDGSRVERLQVRGPDGLGELRPPRLVIAAGGVETTRLLLASQQNQPTAFGGVDGPLGRFYMGHLSGRIADLVLDRPADVAWHDFFAEGGVYARRRLTLSPEVQARDQLLNISFWADNPRFHDVQHQDPFLSLVWLVLATPVAGGRIVSEGVRMSHLGPEPRAPGAHLRNLLRRPHRAAASLLRLVQDRYLSSPRKPGFLIRNPTGRYALHYHAEQVPHAESRIRLLPGETSADLPPVQIDLRHTTQDFASVVHAHQRLDAALRAAKVARLDFHAHPEALPATVAAQAADGFHQIGSTRMSADARDGVVDKNLRVHGVANLYLASSSVFATSGQANPTLLAVMLGLRLADHVAAAALGDRP